MEITSYEIPTDWDKPPLEVIRQLCGTYWRHAQIADMIDEQRYDEQETLKRIVSLTEGSWHHEEIHRVAAKAIS